MEGAERMDIIPIEKKNLVDEVYSQMSEEIYSGQWHEGDKLASENQLCELFNVSRVVIREALQRLRTQGLIVTRRGMGSYVSNPKNFPSGYQAPAANATLQISEEDFTSFLEFRSCFEFRAIELSITNATADDYAEIGSALQRMKKSVGDLNSYSQADLDFHAAIIKSAHNVFFTQAVKSCQNMILFCFKEMNRLHDSQNWGIETHRNIAEYLVAKDAKNAIKVIKKNDEYNLARLAVFFKQSSSK